MNCPKCGYLQLCPCPACTDRRAEKQAFVGTKPWIEDETVVWIQCANCGFTADWAEWEKISIKQTKESECQKCYTEKNQ